MAGLSILKRLLMKQAMKESAPFQHEGIMSISKSLAGNVDTKIKGMRRAAEKQGVDLDKLSEQEIKYMLELNKPKEPVVLSNEEAFEFLNKFLNQGKKGEVIRGKFKPLVTVDSVITDIKKLKPMDSMKETNKVLKGEGKYKNLSKADREKIAGDESVTDHIFERNIEPDLEDFAYGGVAGLLGERTGYIHGGITHSDGRRGFFTGAQAATRGPAGGQAMSPGTSTTGGTRHGGGGGGSGGSGGTTTIIPKSKPKPKPKRKIPLTSGSLQFVNPIKKFIDHDKFTDQIKFLDTDDKYHQLGGLDFMMRFPGVNPNIAKGLATGYQYVTEGARALTDSNKNFSDAMSKAAEEAKLNAIGIDAALDPNSNLYQQYTGLVDSANLVPNTLKMASGGRIGFSKGKLANLARRNFMKLLGAGAAGIGALKTGAFKLLGKEAAPVAEEVVKSAGSGTTPPPYFFKLVEKIKILGDDVTTKYETQQRQKITKYKDYELTEDITTGEKTIQKFKLSELDEGPSNMVEETYMNYKPGKGQMDETTKGKTPPDEYTEDTTYIRGDGGNKGGIYSSVDGVGDDVIMEVEAGSGSVPESFYTGPNPIKKIKKASGGLAHMVGE